MKTNQPSWHCIANLGDATPEDHGGAFVLVDKRGIYTPELWLCEPGERDGSGAQWSTILLEQLTPCPSAKENLGDNRFRITGAFSLTCFGDFVERNERRYSLR